VGRIQCGGNLFDHFDRELGGHRAALGQRRVQIDSFDYRHHEIQATVYLARVIDRDDVRFVQSRHRVGLAPETLHVPTFAKQIGGQHLDRDVAPDFRVVSPVHLTHAALADQADQPITPEEFFIHRGTALARSACYRPIAQRAPCSIGSTGHRGPSQPGGPSSPPVGNE
jgi:hypothetical protein